MTDRSHRQPHPSIATDDGEVSRAAVATATIAGKLLDLARLAFELGGPYASQPLVRPPAEVLAVLQPIAELFPDACNACNAEGCDPDIILRVGVAGVELAVYGIAPSDAILRSIAERAHGPDEPYGAITARWARESIAAKNTGGALMAAAGRLVDCVPVTVELDR